MYIYMYMRDSCILNNGKVYIPGVYIVFRTCNLRCNIKLTINNIVISLVSSIV